MSELVSATDTASESAFIAPVAMENDPAEIFPGDHGCLSQDERRVLVRLLQRRFLLAESNAEDWEILINSQVRLESHLNDMFVRLVVDHDRGLAYKEQIRSDEIDIPILLRDDAYTRAETLVLVYLRTIYQRESSAGESSVRVDVEDIEQTVLTYFAESDGTTARKQKSIRTAVARLERDGLLEEQSEGRYRISPIIEIVLSAQKLVELRDWLQEKIASHTHAQAEQASTQRGQTDRDSAEFILSPDNRGRGEMNGDGEEPEEQTTADDAPIEWAPDSHGQPSGQQGELR